MVSTIVIQATTLVFFIVIAVASVGWACRNGNKWGHMVAPFMWAAHGIVFYAHLLYSELACGSYPPNQAVTVPWASALRLQGAITVLAMLVTIQSLRRLLHDRHDPGSARCHHSG